MTKQELLQERISGKTYSQIAKDAGISRQRIQQILSPPKEIQRIVRQRQQGLCVRCGKELRMSGHIHHKELKEDYNDISNLELLCISCHRLEHCEIVYLECSVCGKRFHSRDVRARVRRNISGLYFCSKACQGKWLSDSYGFGKRG